WVYVGERAPDDISCEGIFVRHAHCIPHAGTSGRRADLGAPLLLPGNGTCLVDFPLLPEIGERGDRPLVPLFLQALITVLIVMCLLMNLAVEPFDLVMQPLFFLRCQRAILKGTLLMSLDGFQFLL